MEQGNSGDNLRKNDTAKKGAAIAAIFTVAILAASTLLLIAVYLTKNPVNIPQEFENTKPQIYTQNPPEDGNGMPTTEVVAKVSKSVVSVELYNKGSRKSNGSGSGIIVSPDGYIVTNYHVVEGASSIRVLLEDGNGYTAVLVGVDPRHDLAILKIDAKNLTPAEFGDSDKVQVGQSAIAIGNAAGLLPGSPTQGIISGVNREIPMETSEGYVNMKLLQTDAAINPGNSGGALVNMYGQVIGINIAKLQSIEIDNIGFAIPANEAIPVIQQLITYGKMPETPKLGVIVWELNETIGPEMGLPKEGLYIEKIEKESDLNRFNINVGDVIISVNGKKMVTSSDLLGTLEKLNTGDSVKMEIYIAKSKEIIEVEPVLYTSNKA